jgi:hypothetical protein
VGAVFALAHGEVDVDGLAVGGGGADAVQEEVWWVATDVLAVGRGAAAFVVLAA